jgi:hypothetical protein
MHATELVGTSKVGSRRVRGAGGYCVLATFLLIALGSGHTDAEPPQEFAPGAAATLPTMPFEAPPAGPQLMLPEPEEDCVFWDAYVKGGSVHALGGGFLEDRFENGWTVQVGARQWVQTPYPFLFLYAEIGGMYASCEGDNVPFLRPADIFTAGPGATRQTLSGPVVLRLNQLDRYGIHLAAGEQFSLVNLLGESGGNLYLNLRVGLRGGGVELEETQFLTPELSAALSGALAQVPPPSFFQFTRPVQQPELFFGTFTGVGIGTTCHDVRVLGLCLGDVGLGAEVEFSYDWLMDLGELHRLDRNLLTIMPMVTVQFAF